MTHAAGGPASRPRQVGGACRAGLCTHPVTWLWGLCPLREHSRPTGRSSPAHLQALTGPLFPSPRCPSTPTLDSGPDPAQPAPAGEQRPATRSHPPPRPSAVPPSHPTQPSSPPAAQGRLSWRRSWSRSRPRALWANRPLGAACRKSWGNEEGRRDQMQPQQRQAPGFPAPMAGGDITGPRGQQDSGAEGKAVPARRGVGVAVTPRVR